MATVAKKVEVEDHMESGIDVLSNTVRAIGAKLDRLSQKIDSHDEKIGAISTRLDGVDKRFDRLDQRVDRLDQKSDRLDAKMDTVSTQLTSAIRSVSERIDRQWESLNAHQREMKIMIEKIMESRGGDKRWWVLITVALLGSLAACPLALTRKRQCERERPYSQMPADQQAPLTQPAERTSVGPSAQ